MVQVIEYIKKDALKAKTAVNASYLWKVGTFLTVCTTASMRGYEGFYLEIAGLMYYQDRGINGEIPEQLNRNAILVEDQYEALPFIVLLLLGKFKGGHTIDRHLINVASKTLSGLEPRCWIERLLEVCSLEGRKQEPAFATED